jgi:hypothetical protein
MISVIIFLAGLFAGSMAAVLAVVFVASYGATVIGHGH